MGADRRRCADGDAIDDRRRRCFYCSFCFAADAHDRSHDHRDGEVLMFRQTYLSDAIPYRKPEDWAGIPNGIGLQSLYNGYLITPPRLYAEELGASSVTAMFTLRQDMVPDNTHWSHSVSAPSPWSRCSAPSVPPPASPRLRRKAGPWV